MTKFKLKDKVKVLKGKFKGKVGFIHAIQMNGSKKKGKDKYFLKIEGIPKRKLEWFPETSLVSV